jgi:hypothetical protein
VDGVIVDLTPGVPHAFQTLVAAIDEADQELNRNPQPVPPRFFLPV